jgi:hypothetical protein
MSLAGDDTDVQEGILDGLLPRCVVRQGISTFSASPRRWLRQNEIL